MKREIIINPAFDKTDPNPSKNYGIHGCDMIFLLTGEVGAISLTIFTNWYLPHVDRVLRAKNKHNSDHDFMFRPQGADISYHSPTPQYEDQSSSGPCKYLGGRECYCAGSGLQAIEICDKLISEGSEYVWKILEARYKATFSDGQCSH